MPNLTAPAERALHAAAREGDRTAVAALAEAYDPWLRAMAAEALRRSHGAEYDDLLQEARLAFLESVPRVDDRHRLATSTRAPVARALHEASGSRLIRVPSTTLGRYWAAMKAADCDPEEAARLAPSFDLAVSTFWDVHRAVGEFATLDALETDEDDVDA